MSILEYILFVFIPAGIAYYLLIRYEIPKKWPRWCKAIGAVIICTLFLYTLFLHLTQKGEGFISVRIWPPQEATIFIDSTERGKIDFADSFLVNAGYHTVIAKLITSEQKTKEVEVDPNDNIPVDFVFMKY